MVIVAGDYSLTVYEGTEQEIQPQILLPHPDYNSVTNNSDIMLIKVRSWKLLSDAPSRSFYWSSCPLSLQLRAPVFLNSYISVVLLPRQDATIAEGKMCRVSGWGYTAPSGGQIPSTLRTVTLPIVSMEKCNSSDSFNGSITESMLCAGYSLGGKDACQVKESFLLLWVVEWIDGWMGRWVIWKGVEGRGIDE